MTAEVVNRMSRREARPSHYKDCWRDAFDEAMRPFLAPDVAVLDIGSGRDPTIATADRPEGCRYVGLDISDLEIRLAGENAYDEIVIRDIATHDPSLCGQFDLALSWDVMEHLRNLDRAFANIHSYLRPGGALVAQFAGKFSAFGLMNQLIPSRAGLRFRAQLLGPDVQTAFPAHYHRCYAGALARILTNWSNFQIVPRFRGADYFSFSPYFQGIYLRYENWAMRSGRANLATHYLVVAQK